MTDGGIETSILFRTISLAPAFVSLIKESESIMSLMYSNVLIVLHKAFAGLNDYFFTLPACSPHSFFVASSHHQRPSRSCCPGRTGFVQGSHPMLPNPSSCSLLNGTSFSLM